MRRLVGILAAVLCAVAAAVLTWPPFFHLERTYPIAQIVSFRSLMVVGFGVVLVLALLLAIARPLRGFAAALAIIALVAGVANAGILFSRGMGSDTLPAKGADSIRVMTWNTAGAATSPDDIARTAVAMDADIVTLPETTIATGEQVALAMRALGHRMWAYHTQYGAHGWDASSTTLLISPRLGTYSVIESSADGTSNTSTVPSAVAMPTSGSGPVIVAAHAVAPRQEYMQRWRHDLQWIADQCAAKDVILAGDFNATVDHMSGFGVDGGTMGRCHDAVGATGNGAVGTWPTSLPAWAGAPIDHVMATSDWKATGSVVLRSLDGKGSDHRPLVVQLDPAN
ncbi:MAG: endonuclease/exonuclease/phosphatase family protein [Microbacterium sp.]|uniref:endonuclease/exonuclease/phosphatase family protein n=1 Tax=Microbacterium sp. TaxID=51671 RepID=UPI001ACD8DFD|nr:endonuclease/exonuclease/phosphatase family protein [Microbacterium sp.]MBN9173240.1 endonuclease/exonuclease/phosphatase family protein [Microbacterium sp.]